MLNPAPLLLVVFLACSESPAPQAPTSATPKAEGVAPAPVKDSGAIVGITLKVQDYQVFHPFSRTRALLQATSPTPTPRRKGKKGLAKAKDSFGAGLVVDATNNSAHLLSSPDLLGEFTMKGTHGTVRCELDPKRSRQGRGDNHLSHDPTSKNPWRDESKQNYEKVWRPGETIRLRVREDCGNFFVYDTDLQTISTSFKVEARSMLHPGNPDLTFPLNDPDAPLVRSETMTLSLPPSSVVLQKVQLGDEWAHAAGDVVIQWNGNAVVRGTLGSLGHRADTLTRADLPSALEGASASFNELSFAATSTKLVHWIDTKRISKGLRRLSVEGSLTLDSGKLKTRIKGDVDTSTPQGKAAVNRGVTTETARLLALIPCNRIALVTTKRAIFPTNGADAIAACAKLTLETPAAIKLQYTLGRYEVPVGLILRTRTSQQFVPIAHQALLSFDPR